MMNFTFLKSSHKVSLSPGIDPKKAKLAARRARLWNAAGFILLFWGLFYPQPYEKVVLLLIIFPVLMLMVLAQYRGLITLDVDRFHADRPHMVAAFLAPIGVLFYRGIDDWNVMNWQGFWLPFFVIGAVFYILTLILAEDIRAKISSMLMLIAFSAAFGFGATLAINGIMDASLAVVYQTKVLDKSVSHGKVTTYYLKLAPWGPVKKASQTHVPISTYNRMSIGDTVKIYTHQGRLGVPWYMVE